MNIPFLQKLTGPALHKVVGLGPAGAERAVAERVLHRVLAGLPELLAAAVVRIDTGQVLASYTTARELNPEKVAAFNAEVVKQQRQALAALRQSDEALEDILITLRTQLHLLRVLADGRHLLYVAADCRDTNLGMAREVLRTCEA
ncbi:hypothetical protein EJV47_23965 [Hymenobacter gummosus]|uniref:Roadblock/LC7 domain-containing protein n=1 Tax=Hymenobacter gummosus TaxID=1776032 RepID=A0A3S0HJU2_9BACT|nr:hypothetical protein [Hymenobacter gummosus]RTQ45889.1 hypothetical protein EJV47_23965 [Hymenobacter gummosus]